MPSTARSLEPFLEAQAIQERVRELAGAIAAGREPAAADEALHVVAVLDGAWVFAADLVRALARPVTVDFVRARSYGAGTRSGGEVRLVLDVETDVAGRDVLLVDDILDTGRTMRHLIDHLGVRGPRSLTTAVLLDKPARRAVSVEADHVGFVVPDVFLVGYGLDHAGRHRERPGLWQLRDEEG